jgi:cell division protein FtsB
MAKALVGHLGTVDPRHTREIMVLRRRVADLEAEVGRLKAENDALAAAYSRDTSSVVPGDLVDLEPALS